MSPNQDVGPLKALVSDLAGQYATHDEALRQLAAIISDTVCQNPKVISKAVGLAFRQLVDDDVFVFVVRTELARVSVGAARPMYSFLAP
eukprot:4912339-Pyramimonas_sp.AAC.1